MRTSSVRHAASVNHDDFAHRTPRAVEQCNDNGNVAYLSRDELKDAVLLWRRIEKSTRPSPTDRSRTGRQLGACCLKLCCG